MGKAVPFKLGRQVLEAASQIDVVALYKVVYADLLGGQALLINAQVLWRDIPREVLLRESVKRHGVGIDVGHKSPANK
jgi:hypothetical protein